VIIKNTLLLSDQARHKSWMEAALGLICTDCRSEYWHTDPETRPDDRDEMVYCRFTMTVRTNQGWRLSVAMKTTTFAGTATAA
jgi:hypothetical protein